MVFEGYYRTLSVANLSILVPQHKKFVDSDLGLSCIAE